MAAKQSTDTNGFSLVPENNYDAMIRKVTKKEITGGFIIYEWNFESFVNEKPFFFKISMFSSQMAELLRALGATEISKGKFDWDDEEVVGNTLNFNVVHVADKKGTLREQLSDIKLLTQSAKTSNNVEEIKWDNE